MTIWGDLTAAGDSAVMLPLIAWITLWLIVPAATRRIGSWWIFAVVLCGGSVALSKLLFMGWGIGLPGLDYTGFSGHSALSALVWPALAALLAQRSSASVRAAATGAGIALALAIALSRIFLKAHSVSEVVLGCSLGLAVTGWFLLTRVVPRQASPRSVALLGAGALLLVLVSYGRVFPSQDVLKQVALAVSGRAQVFRRPLHLP